MQLAPVYPLLYRILKPLFPGCLWSGSGDRRCVALTFDDGPHPRYTPPLLDVLERHGVTASFFWLGAAVDAAPEAARQVYERGHYLALHGYYHRVFTSLGDRDLKASLERTQTAIARACGIDGSRIRDVRPPNGIFSPHTLHLLRQWQYRAVMWSVVPEDWLRPGVEVAIARILEQVEPGSTIVLHDGPSGGPDVAATTDGLLGKMRSQNWEFVTVAKLWHSHAARNAPSAAVR